jgi:hypothetical protein
MRTGHSRIWLITLLLGAGLSWPVPLGGVLLAVVASFGLVISWEDELSRGEMTPVPAHKQSDAQALGRTSSAMSTLR